MRPRGCRPQLPPHGGNFELLRTTGNGEYQRRHRSRSELRAVAASRILWACDIQRGCHGLLQRGRTEV